MKKAAARRLHGYANPELARIERPEPAPVVQAGPTQPESWADSPFIVGIVGDPFLDPADGLRAHKIVADILQDIKCRLPETELRMMPAHIGTAQAQIERVALDLGIRTESCGASEASQTDGILRRCSLLIAVWDGRASPVAGDTVLKFLAARSRSALDDALQFVAAADAYDGAGRYVYWIKVGDGAAGHRPCFLTGVADNVIEMQQAMPLTLQRQMQELNEYNADARRVVAAGGGSLLSGLPDGLSAQSARELTEIDRQYRKGDALATHYQRLSDRLFDLFGLMAFTMGLAYLTYEKLTESRALLVAYVLILFAGLCAYLALRKRRWFGKHLTYRTLTETLRTRFYLTLAGAHAELNTNDIFTLFGIGKFQGFSLISIVLNGVEPADPGPGVRGESNPAHVAAVEQAWIEHQHAYFSAKVAQLEGTSRRIRRLKLLLLFSLLVMILTMFIFGESLHRNIGGLGISIKNLMAFCLGALAIGLGVWELREDQRATRELLWQYRNQLGHFARARKRLPQIKTRSRRNEIILALGRDSLMESYLWATHRYHREHKPPAL